MSERLRRVRVVCGDWTRVCGGNWQDKAGVWDVGVFFDPPYAVEDRRIGVYHQDSTDVAHAVREWCIERGKKPTYRIVLAGYDEHAELADHGWHSVAWKTDGGYGNTARNGAKTRGQENRKREVLWLSPYCHKTDLFHETETEDE